MSAYRKAQASTLSHHLTMPWKGGYRRRLALPGHGARSSAPRDRSRSPRPGRESHGAVPASAAGLEVAQVASTQNRFREVLGDFFLNNTLSARQTHELARSSADSGASGIADFVRAGASGSQPGNLCRDLLRCLAKGSSWPSLYYFKCPFWIGQQRISSK